MDYKQLILPLIIALLAVIVVITCYVVFETKRQNKKSAAILKSKSTKVKNKSLIYLKSYNKLERTPIISGWILRIRKKVETVAVYDDLDIRRETMKIFFRFVAIGSIILALLLIIRPGWLVSFWVFVGILFSIGLATDKFVFKAEMKLLEQLKYYNSRIRHYFQQTKMVDEAAYESISDVGPEMKIQATHIHNNLMSINPDKSQSDYEQIAPSRFLKVVSGLMVLVKDKGDVVDKERGSSFSRGISAITKELNTEIMYRSKLAHRMKFLAGMAIIPIFFALPIQYALTNMFPILQKYYESRTGLIAAVLIYLSSISFYLLIRKIKSVGETQYKAKDDKHWEKWMLEKIPGLERLMLALAPKRSTKKYAKRFQLIKDANSAPHVTWLTLRQTILATLAVLVLVVILIFGHARESYSTLNSILPDGLTSGNLTTEEYEQYVLQNEFDRNFIADLQSNYKSPTEIQQKLVDVLGADEITDTKVQNEYKRIMKKYKTVENAYLKWWEVIVVLVVAALVWQIPVILLHFQRSLRLKDMENEVHQFLTIISILKEFDSITVYTLLTWLERFSVTFKAPLQVAIQNYDSGSEEALERLAEDNNFDAFKQIIERMQLALTRLSVKEAFEDIEIEREFYHEQRIEYNDRSIGSKVAMGTIFSFIPASLLLICYFVGPVLYMSITEMLNLMNSL